MKTDRAHAPANPNGRAPARTRQRILAAALKEFSAKGLAGARVNAIATRAAINKRMLYHYFGNKRDLFRAVLEYKMAERVTWLANAPEDPMDIMAYWFNLICHDADWIRLLEWEALQESSEKVVSECERRESAARFIDRVRLGQKRGKVSRELDPEQLVLSMTASIIFPMAFPQLTRLITGRIPSDEKFQKDRANFLSQFAKVIRSHGNGERKEAARGSAE